MDSPRFQKRKGLIKHISPPVRSLPPSLLLSLFYIPQLLIKGTQPLTRIIPPLFASNKPIIHIPIFVPFLMSTKVIVDVFETVAGVEGFDEELVVVLGGLGLVGGVGEDRAVVD